MVSYDEIKHSVPIHVVLRKYGFHAPAREIYRIPCPLHGGRDANFSVSEREGLWNCFSVCQRGGSVIDLVAALDKIDIKEAARKLGSDFNLSPAHASVAVARATTSKVERWKELQKYPSDIQLPDTIELEEGYRGLTRKTIDHWGLRRVPPPPSIRTIIHPVGQAMPRDFDILDQYGAITWKTVPSGVLIPLHNAHGGICSYSVRKDEGTPKIWNAPGISKCYPFGLQKNTEDIISEGFVWLVEGQIDCIKMWQRGYKNTVALMGSSLSENQAMLLLTVTSTIMLLMDGDDAGRKAAKEIKKRWSKVFEIGEFVLPEGVDPAEYEEKLER